MSNSDIEKSHDRKSSEDSMKNSEAVEESNIEEHESICFNLVEEDESKLIVRKLAHDILDEKYRSGDVKLNLGRSYVQFKDFGFSKEIIDGLNKAGFQYPAPIQYESLPCGIRGDDLLIHAKSGTGKTCVFSLLALNALNLEEKHLQILIIAPSRELAIQNSHVIETIGSALKIEIATFIGGLSLRKDAEALKTAQIGVGTPGRLDHLCRSFGLNLSKVKLVVLDEADKLVDVSFIENVCNLLDSMNPEKQIIAASATYPDQLDSFIVRFMKKPFVVQVDKNTQVLAGVNLVAVDVKTIIYFPDKLITTSSDLHRLKLDCLTKILCGFSFSQCIVFCKYQARSRQLQEHLQELGHDVALLTGELSQEIRTMAYNQFFKNNRKILIATDLCARGLDSQTVDLVINFDCPVTATTYLHRAGRAGRFGSFGTSITLLLGKSEWNFLSDLPEKIQHNIKMVDSLEKFELLCKKHMNELVSFRNLKNAENSFQKASWMKDPSWIRRRNWCKQVDNLDRSELFSYENLTKYTKFPLDSECRGREKIEKWFNSALEKLKKPNHMDEKGKGRGRSYRRDDTALSECEDSSDSEFEYVSCPDKSSFI